MKLAYRILPYKVADPIRLVAVGDFHLGSGAFHRRRFTRFMEYQASLPYTHFIIMGDIFDALVVNDSKRFRLSGIDRRYLNAENPDRFLDMQVDDGVELLEPYKKNILGILRGNHEDQILKRYNTDMVDQLCTRLGSRELDLGYSSLVYLSLRRETSSGTDNRGGSRALKLYLHHGFGGGSRTEGGAITTYARFIMYYDADIYLVAHSHQLWSKKIARIGITQHGEWEDRTIILANTGTFKKSLVEGTPPTWEETMGFNPRLLGGIVVEIKMDRKNSYPSLSVSDV